VIHGSMSGVLGIREIGGCLQKETLVKLSSGHVNVNFLYSQPEARDFEFLIIGLRSQGCRDTRNSRMHKIRRHTSDHVSRCLSKEGVLLNYQLKIS
jgi:hypothetical protein